jgi:hypothetical protein
MAAVGSFTVTTADLGAQLKKVSIAWTASAGGAVSGASFPLARGHILQVKFVPTNGGVQPSNNYAATLVDADGVDLLAGKGATLSNTAASIAVPAVSSLSPAFNDPSIGSPPGSVTPTIASAGNGGQGRIDLIVGP